MSTARLVTRADVESVEISKITLGERRRKVLGNVTSLSRSIEQYGLVHPILLRNGFELVAGQRRLEACKRLGWKSIPARHVETLSDADLRSIELDENRHRLALSDFESSKARLAEIRVAQAKLKIGAISNRADSKKPRARRARVDEAMEGLVL